MPRWVVVLALFAVAGFSAWRAVAASKAVPEGERGPLVGQAVVMQLVLLTNAMAFVDWVGIEWWSGRHLGPAASSPWTLAMNQAALLIGTFGLMELVVQAVDDPRSRPDGAPVPELILVAVEKLLPRFWLAALGLATIFGVTARGVALLLAVELTLMWIAGRGLRAWGRGRPPP